MSASPADVVRQLYETWTSFDFRAAGELYARDVVFEWSRRQVDPRVVEGRAAAVRVTREILEPFEEARIEVERLVVDGERVTALVHAQVRGRASGAVTGAHVAHVWTVREGLIERMEYYGNQAEALAAAGVRE